MLKLARGHISFVTYTTVDGVLFLIYVYLTYFHLAHGDLLHVFFLLIFGRGGGV